MTESSYPMHGTPWVQCSNCGLVRPPVTLEAGKCKDSKLCGVWKVEVRK